ncbi:MAG: hypothetical protein SFU98_15765 [Leptospiraceae bacterium]|nr:hypothetical protein [Leptospiraceae bacterium]
MIFTILSIICFLLANLLLVNIAIEHHFIKLANSDLLYVPVFVEELFQNPKILSTWVLPPAPSFFPDIILFSFSRVFTKHLGINLFLYSLTFNSLLLFSLLKLKEIFQNRKNHQSDISYSALFFSFWILLISTHPNELSLFFFPSYHGSVILLLIFSIFSIFHKQKFALLGILFYLFYISDKHSLVIFLFPIILIIFLDKKNFNLKSKIYLLSTLLLIVMLGNQTLKFLKNNSIFYIPEISLQQAFRNNLSFVQLKNNIFLTFPLALDFFLTLFQSYLFFFIFFFSALLYSIIFFKNFSEKQRLILLVLLFSLFASISSQIVLGFWVGSRYLWGIYFFPLIILVLNFNASSLKLLFCLFLIFLCYTFFHFDLTFQHILYKTYPKEISCLDRIAKEKNLLNGISDYWNAKYIRYFQKERYAINQVFSDSKDYDWVSNRNWRNSLRIDFVLIEGIDPKAIENKFGQPFEKLFCEKKEIWIYHKPNP